MLNNRYFINTLISKIENLQVDKKCLLDDIKEKEIYIIDLLNASKELSLENEDLKKKINILEEVINKHKDNECQLNTLLCIQNGRVEKLNNYIKITYDIDLLAEDNREIKRIIRRAKDSE